MLPSISVVIPCYNAQNTIRRCLRSIFDQTIPVSEIIVVDDGSTDNSIAEIEATLREHPGGASCRLIVQSKNQGPSAARNLGIKQASGEFIALIDSDDFWLPNHIECNLKIFHQLESSSAAIVHQPLLESELNHMQFGPNSGVSFKRFSLVYYLFIQKNCSTITLFAPSKLVKACKFPESQKFAEDFRFFIRLFSVACERAFILAPRTAVMGKHAWASGEGLSSKRGKMLLGVLKALICELGLTRFAVLLPLLLPWHVAKAIRREYIYGLRER